MEISKLLTSLTWSGDKASAARQAGLSLLHSEERDWPTPTIGDAVTVAGEEDTLFTGYVIKRSLDSEGSIMDCVCYDGGIYLRNNDGTYKFRSASPDYIARTVCAERGVPVYALAGANASIDRKFSGVRLDQIIRTAYTLASEQTGERYILRMRPQGLEVKVLAQSAGSVNLRPRSNLMRAATTESIEAMVNSVGIYDETGIRVGTVSNREAIALYGVMERHITRREGEDASSKAQALLEDGALAQTVTVEVLGDERLITGETVVVSEENTGLKGLFWIDADAHTWRRDTYTCRLTLNCRGVMATASAGGALT